MIKGKYKHYKGKYYKVLGIAVHSETGNEYVVYKALYGTRKIWIRPRRMFFEEGNFGKQNKRFEKVPNPIIRLLAWILSPIIRRNIVRW